MIDINNTLDLIKIKFYNEWLYTAHIYEEGESGFHQQLTEKVVNEYIDPIALPKNASLHFIRRVPNYLLLKFP